MLLLLLRCACGSFILFGVLTGVLLLLLGGGGI